MATFLLFQGLVFGLAAGLLAPLRPWARGGLGCAVFLAAFALASLADPPPLVLLREALAPRTPSNAPSALSRRLHDAGVFDADIRRATKYRRMADVLRRSDAVADARADLTAGAVGLMTTALQENGPPHASPALTCGRTYGERVTTLLHLRHLTISFGAYHGRHRPRLPEATSLFQTYASAYNRHVFDHAPQPPQGCPAAGEGQAMTVPASEEGDTGRKNGGSGRKRVKKRYIVLGLVLAAFCVEKRGAAQIPCRTGPVFFRPTESTALYDGLKREADTFSLPKMAPPASLAIH